MNVSRAVSPGVGARFSPPSRTIQQTLVLAVLFAMVLGGLFVVPNGHAAAGSTASATSTSSGATAAVTPTAAPSVGLTHGDLVVASGQTYTIQPITPGTTYFQGGNITVEKGGTLVINGTILSFVQFIVPTGTPEERLAHIFHFTDAGTVLVRDSTITTDVIGVNVYPKLSVLVSGNMTLWNSTISFPGSIAISGPGSNLTLNSSRIQKNPGIGPLSEPAVIKGDTNFSATLFATNGGHLNLFASNVSNLYSDNFSANGVPAPAPLTALNAVVSNTTNITSLSTPTDTVDLTKDWLYPGGIAGGAVTFTYNDSSALPTTSHVTVWYNGVGYSLAPVTFRNDTSGANVTDAFTPNLTHAVNAAGMLNFLNYTGDFGVGPAKIAIQFSSLTGPQVLARQVSLTLTPPVSNDLAINGTGSEVSSVDSSINLTFNDTPIAHTSVLHPFPWLSNKLVLTNGSTGMLANITFDQKIANVFNSSAIIADSTSHAYVFRWAKFALTGRGGFLPVQRGTVRAFCAFNATQSNNATANGLNNLQASNPAIWAFLQYWDSKAGVPAYATSGAGGVAYLLLAASDISGTSFPGGVFLGGYHILERIPVATNNTRAFNWSVSAYPIGEALHTPGYGLPDSGPTTTFDSYYGALSATGVSYLANGTGPAGSVRYGQLLTAQVVVKNVGPAPVVSILAGMFYNTTFGTLLSTNQTTLDLTENSSATVNIQWLVNDSVTGLKSRFTNNFGFNIQWNDGNLLEGGGTVTTNGTIAIVPSRVAIKDVSSPNTTLPADQGQQSNGNVTYNGTHGDIVGLLALPIGGGTAVLLGTTNVGPARHNGHTIPFEIFWNTSSLTPGTKYTLQYFSTYNTFNNTTNLSGPFVVPPPPSSTPSNILFQKFLGEPLWLWIALAAGIVIIVVGLLMFSRRQAAGKLVECGECGNLIPEDARVCPKCGAEFEADVVRCSRCASTIPAASKFCPECAAQLLGRPEDAAEDPDRQAYNDYTERFRAEGKKELGENYTDSAFWDWWKRQPTYTPFSQWKLQQSQGAPRTGMAAPPGVQQAESGGSMGRRPPNQGSGGGTSTPDVRSAGSTPTGNKPNPSAPPPAAGAMKPCPSCSREIPSEYLVCPFCGSVTQ